MADSSATDSGMSKEKPKRKIFRWNSENIEHLINFLMEYKAEMDFKAIDFQADKPKMYDEIRKKMAKIDGEAFGPEVAVTVDFTAEISQQELEELKMKNKTQKAQINKGRNRVQEKIKEIRQGYSKAVLNGTRSGSGKLVYEFYDKLVLIWGGSASAEPLSYGVSTDSIVNISESEGVEHWEIDGDNNNHYDDDSFDNVDDGEILSNDGKETSSTDYVNDTVSDDDSCKENDNILKRKSVVPKLVDNKRKHLARNLSAAQRDKMLLEEAKEDAQFRKDLAKAMRESNAAFNKSVQNIGNSILQLSQSMSRSMEMFSQAMLQQANANRQPYQPYHQNLFYQNIPSPQQCNRFQHQPQPGPNNDVQQSFTRWLNDNSDDS